jgi:glutamate 5-kinase
VLLTDVDRLYSGDPRLDPQAQPILEVGGPEGIDRLQGVAGDGGRWGTGGMGTKLTAARIATASGVKVRLADGRDPTVLDALLAGDGVGTLLHPSPTPLSDRKGWLAHALVPVGSLRLDAGAERALVHQGASLLAVGISAVEGSFARQQPVRLLALDGRELGRGLSEFSSDELRQILGLSSGEIRQKLGSISDEVVHRDQLVLNPVPPGAAQPAQGPADQE